MPRARLLLFLAAVFALKLIVVAQLHDHPLLQPDAGMDTSVYVSLAERVRAGDLLLGPGLYYVSPLYIYWLATAFAAGGSFTAVRVLQAALGTVAVGLIFVAARRWFSERAAWLAAGAAALTGLFAFYESLLMQAALDPFLTAAALAALAIGLTSTAGVEEGKRLARAFWFGAAGVAFGLQTLNRPNVLLPVVVVVALLVALRRWRQAAWVTVGVSIALAPAALRNAAAAGTWSPVASHGGLNFYIGNNPAADGTYHSVPGVTPNIAGQARDTRRVAEAASGRSLSDSEVSNYFLRLGFTWIRQHPSAAVLLTLKKLRLTFSAVHVPLNDSYPFYAYDAGTILRGLPIGAWILIPLGVSGLVLCAPRDRRPEFLAWASFVPAYAVAVAIFFAADRYRLPLLVPMCVGAGALIDAVLLKGVRRCSPALVTASLLFVAVNWPLHIDDGRAEERTRMAEERGLAGDTGDATRWADAAEAVGGDPAVVELRVGRALLQSAHAADAAARLARASASAPGSPEVDYAYGQALLDAGRAADAIPHLRAAVEHGVRPDVAGIDLVKALQAVGDVAGAREALATVAPANPADAQSWLALGDAAIQLQASDLELRFFGRAAEANPADPTAQLNLAVALAQAGRIPDARQHAEAALRLRPDYEKARALLDALNRLRNK